MLKANPADDIGTVDPSARKAFISAILSAAFDPAELDALVLSHGHYDHFGGVVGFLRQNAGKLKAKAAALHWRRGALLLAGVGWPAGPGNFGALDRQALKLAKSEIPAKLLRSYTGSRFVFEGHAA